MICQTTGAAIATRSQLVLGHSRESRPAKQAGIEREIGRQQNDEEDVNRTWHTAELRDADIDPVDTGAKQPESPEIADPGALQRASVEGQRLQTDQRNDSCRPEVIR